MNLLLLFIIMYYLFRQYYQDGTMIIFHLNCDFFDIIVPVNIGVSIFLSRRKQWCWLLFGLDWIRLLNEDWYILRISDI